MSWLCNRASGALDRADDARMRSTSAQMPRERGSDLVLGRIRIVVEQHLRRQCHRRDTVPALRRLFFDERSLHGVQLRRRAKALGSDDLPAYECARRCDARRQHLAVDDDRARAALLQTTSELRRCQPKVVSQDIQQRCRRVDSDHTRLAVDLKLKRLCKI